MVHVFDDLPHASSYNYLIDINYYSVARATEIQPLYSYTSLIINLTPFTHIVSYLY